MDEAFRWHPIEDTSYKKDEGVELILWRDCGGRPELISADYWASMDRFWSLNGIEPQIIDPASVIRWGYLDALTEVICAPCYI